MDRAVWKSEIYKWDRVGSLGGVRYGANYDWNIPWKLFTFLRKLYCYKSQITYCSELMRALCTGDALVMHLWCADDALVICCWSTDDTLVMRGRCTDDALMMHWWCADDALLMHCDALMMHYWCTFDALMMHLWCGVEARMIHWWCTYEAGMMRGWCTDDALMIHLWCTDDAHVGKNTIYYFPNKKSEILLRFCLTRKRVNQMVNKVLPSQTPTSFP